MGLKLGKEILKRDVKKEKKKLTGKIVKPAPKKEEPASKPLSGPRGRDVNPSYQRDLVDCIRAGYATLPDGGRNLGVGSSEKLAVREGCRSTGKKSGTGN